MKFLSYIRNYDIVDERAFTLYVEFIKSKFNTIIEENEYVEMHHILPRSMFPEFINEDWNIIRLKYSDHIEAHRLLHLMYRNDGMNYAYFRMKSSKTNYNQLPETREKIRKSKLGKPRKDMCGKKYFGASEERAAEGISKMSQKLKGTVVVKDKNNNSFRVSVTDDRYISGELVPVHTGKTLVNNGTANPEVLNKVLSSRNKKYESIYKYTIDEMVNYVVDSYKHGKIVFSKNKKLHSNYSRLVTGANLDKNEILKLVVQRLGLNP